MAISQSKMSELTNTKGKEVPVDVFHLDQIPDAMENMGWEMAPKLMRHWFSITPSFAFNEESKENLLNLDANLITPSKINDDIITMAWAMRFQQVLEGIKNLKATWSSEAGLSVLKSRLKKLGYNERSNISIGFSSDVKLLDSLAQVNFKVIGDKSDTIDDWYGAMGLSTLKVCVRGYTENLNGKSFFYVELLGFYLKDTYDFLDEKIVGISIPEPLGIWSKKRLLNKVETTSYMSSYVTSSFIDLSRYFSGFVPIFNSDFREWQKKHNSGGDFIVFSDVLWMPPLDKDRVIEL